MSLTPEYEAQIRALPVKTGPERDLLEALDEARAELAAVNELLDLCRSGAFPGSMEAIDAIYEKHAIPAPASPADEEKP